MESPMRPAVANVFVGFLEEQPSYKVPSRRGINKSLVPFNTRLNPYLLLSVRKEYI